MPSRRTFFRQLLGAVAAVATLDPEQLLWTPGERSYFFLHHPPLDEINAVTLKYITPGLCDDFFRCDPLLAYLKSRKVSSFPSPAALQENLIYQEL